ncbi:MAG: hypothetical protein A2X64_08790 [Ignavibacteria bacterium GWF2_33_9]|nr:MAG: hypothetical protein A2X64_08790 [Ignavibacteria bacterium GWF2_33_9]
MRRKKEYHNLNLDRNSILKLVLILGLLTLGAVILEGKLFWVQIIHQKEYEQKAQNYQLLKIEIKANRGKIYDCRGTLLVTNTLSLEIAADPTFVNDTSNLKKKYIFLKFLSQVTNKPVSTFLKKLNTNKQFVILAKDINVRYKQKLNNLKFFGIIINQNSQRSYPFDDLAANVLGFTNSEDRGVTGIEYQYDTLLKGYSGYIILKRDLRRNFHAGAELPSSESIDGSDINLTIDADLQSIVEYELGKGMELTQADGASVIVMNPQTGEILALASSPSFNPNVLSERRSDLVRNRCITDIYEPGSTFKLITAAAALEEKKVKPDELLNGHNGIYTVDGVTINDTHPLGMITFQEAIEHSSNIVFAQVASRLPHDTFSKYLRDFGFGLVTDIELPSEAKGQLPRREQITRVMQRSIGYGYAISTTPLQMLCAYCVAANQGKLVKPYIVKSVTKSDGTVVYRGEPKVIRRVISKETANLLKSLFTGIVDRGTGKAVRIKNLKIAGKTGTSRRLKDGIYVNQYNASFVGFLPEENPQIAMIVVLYNPKGNIYGGTTAAPIFRNIALRIINSSDVLAKAKE